MSYINYYVSRVFEGKWLTLLVKFFTSCGLLLLTVLNPFPLYLYSRKLLFVSAYSVNK